MGKFNISISNETEQRLRRFVSTKYPEQFRKLSATVEEAIRVFLDTTT